MTASTSEAHALSGWLREAALSAGFSAFGVTSAQLTPAIGQRLRAWIAEGMHGTMLWMASRADERADPTALWPAVRSVVMLGLPYTPAIDPFRHQREPDRATISVYALGEDYHDILKKRLKSVASAFARHAGAEVKVFVDTAPVAEKPLAAAAGLGWQGKHSNLISRREGNWLFLGAIYTTADLAAWSEDGRIGACGSCTRCIDICPTRAIVAPYVVDARLCISYLTIEHRGPVPERLRPLLGNRVYGCDDCLAICPWNRFARVPADPALSPRPALQSPLLADFLGLDDARFRALFRKSPVKRIGRDRFVRNCLYAAGNSGMATLLGPVTALADDPDPAVADAARWAAARLQSAGSASIERTLRRI